MCITFDNLPGERDYNSQERENINARILDALAKHKIPAAGFVVGDYIDGDWELIVNWLQNKHTIGFSTNSGQDIENMPHDLFVGDIKKGADIIEDILQTYKQQGRYFRYPFLHYGRKAGERKQVTEILKAQKIRIAHASILIEDFVYNLSFGKMINGRDSVHIGQLKNEYLDHIIESLARAENTAQEVAGRPIRHILLLRHNQVNAYFLEDIIKIFEDRGYNFVSLGHALNDNIYKKPDSYDGIKSLSFLERLKISKE